LCVLLGFVIIFFISEIIQYVVIGRWLMSSAADFLEDLSGFESSPGSLYFDSHFVFKRIMHTLILRRVKLLNLSHLFIDFSHWIWCVDVITWLSWFVLGICFLDVAHLYVILKEKWCCDTLYDDLVDDSLSLKHTLIYFVLFLLFCPSQQRLTVDAFALWIFKKIIRKGSIS
jgi:hypothetical protein